MSLRKPFQPVAFSRDCGVAAWLVPVPSCSAAWPFWGWHVDASAGQLWGRGGGLLLTSWGCTQSGRQTLATLHPGGRFLTMRYQSWFLHRPLSGQSPSGSTGSVGGVGPFRSQQSRAPQGRSLSLHRTF